MTRALWIPLLLLGCIEGPEPLSLGAPSPVPCETGIATDTPFVFTIGGDEVTEFARGLGNRPPTFALVTDTGSDLSHTQSINGTSIELKSDAPLPLDSRIEVQLRDRGALDDVYIADGLFPIPYTTRQQPAVRHWVVNDGIMFVSFSQPLDPASVSSDAVSSSVQNEVVEWLPNAENTVHLRFTSTSGPALLTFSPALLTASGQPVFASGHTIEVAELAHQFEGAEPGQCLNL